MHIPENLGKTPWVENLQIHISHFIIHNTTLKLYFKRIIHKPDRFNHWFEKGRSTCRTPQLNSRLCWKERHLCHSAHLAIAQVKIVERICHKDVPQYVYIQIIITFVKWNRAVCPHLHSNRITVSYQLPTIIFTYIQASMQCAKFPKKQNISTIDHHSNKYRCILELKGMTGTLYHILFNPMLSFSELCKSFGLILRYRLQYS